MIDLQKASLWKRISAFLFDFIMLAILAVLIGYLGAAVVNYDSHYQTMTAKYQQYAEEYGINPEISEEDFAALTPEQLAAYEAASAALGADEEAGKAYTMLMHLTILLVSLSLLLAFLVLEFTVPLLFGNGQTLGKKIFGVGVMFTDFVKINGVGLFIRAILGKYVMETMLPLMLGFMLMMNILPMVGALGLMALLGVTVILPLATKERALIHDKMANTACVDFASQKIFDTPEDVLAYKQKKHHQKVASPNELN